MNLNSIDASVRQFLLDIDRSIRYHNRRRGYFELLHRITNVLTILLSGSVLYELFGSGSIPVAMQLMAVAAAMLSALDLIVGYSASAALHASLSQRFVAVLQKTLVASGEDALKQLQADRLQIEVDEPPVYRALDLLCHNETISAYGFDPKSPTDSKYFVRLNCLERATANLLKWPDIGPKALSRK